MPIDEDYRNEPFGGGDCEDPPFWVSVEAPDGSSRTEAQARAKLAEYDLEKECDCHFEASRVQMYVGPQDRGASTLQVSPQQLADGHGPHEFWQFDDVLNGELS